MSRILVVEDDERIRLSMRLALEDEGYTVDDVASGEDAVAHFANDPSELVLVDLMLPGMDGFETCRALRKQSTVPVIMVTARSDTHDVVAGLEAGADDYVTKPFGMDEFLARVRAAARRADAGAESLPTVQTTDFMLDFANYRATRGDHEVHLTPTEWRLLTALAATPGHLVTHAALLRAAWGPSYGRESNYLRVYANQLRRKLEPDTGRPRYLITEPGVGYRLMV